MNRKGVNMGRQNFVLAAFVGAIVMFVLSFFPVIGPLIGGFVAGLIARGNYRNGAEAGCVAGVIGGLIAFGVIGLFIGPVVLAVAYTLLVAWVSESPPADQQGPPPLAMHDVKAEG